MLTLERAKKDKSTATRLRNCADWNREIARNISRNPNLPYSASSETRMLLQASHLEKLAGDLEDD